MKLESDKMGSEFELITRIRTLFGDDDARAAGILVGIGDDCALLAPGALDLISTDTLVEGVHFRRDWSSAFDIGYKALAVSLSDVAAMGARAGAFLLNLSLPPETSRAFVDALLAGIREARDEAAAAGPALALIGGDTTAVPPGAPMMITTTVLGKSAPAGALLRSGAQVGDRIVILGPTGLAQAGLELLLSDREKSSFPALICAHTRPFPRVKEGAVIGASGLANSMVDTSDGLLQDLGHICRASAVGARIWAARLPRHPELVAYCAQLEKSTTLEANLLRYLLGGGEDFQLCLTVPECQLAELRQCMQRESDKERAEQTAQAAGRSTWELHEIGEITPPEQGISVVDAQGQQLQLDTVGYEHFAP